MMPSRWRKAFSDIVVDDEVIEEAVVLDLDPRDGEALADDLLGFASTATETALELTHRRRQDEDRHRVGHLRADLPGALVVDVEDDAAAVHVRTRALDLGERRPVTVLVNVRPLEERLALDELVELLALDEVVVLAVLFTVSRLPRRVRNAEAKRRKFLPKLPGERRLPGAAGGGKDEEQERFAHRPHCNPGSARKRTTYATFWTCSRIRSISAFSSTTACAMARSWLFAPTVFASRAIS